MILLWSQFGSTGLFTTSGKNGHHRTYQILIFILKTSSLLECYYQSTFYAFSAYLRISLHQLSPFPSAPLDYFQHVIISIILKKPHSWPYTPPILPWTHSNQAFALLFAKMASNGLHIAKSCGQFSVFVLLDQKAASGINNTLLLLGILSSFCSQNTRLSWPLFPQWLLFSASFAA